MAIERQPLMPREGFGIPCSSKQRMTGWKWGYFINPNKQKRMAIITFQEDQHCPGESLCHRKRKAIALISWTT